MSRYIDIEPYEKDGWYLQKRYRNSYGEVIKTTPLVSVSTADAEPVKHGRWKIHGVVDYAGRSTNRHYAECSECGTLTPEWRNISNMPWWIYCPNCGAKMNLDEVKE